jgi:predicted GTPase
VNLRRAQVAVIFKVNSAPEADVERVAANVRETNPGCVVVRAASVISVPGGEVIKGKRVLVVEDGPTLTHGGMATGAGVEAARKFGAGEIVDPRPYAQGHLAEVYEEYPHLGAILPAVGYFKGQLQDLESTLASVPADLVVSATPVALGSVVKVDKPLIQVSYELAETGEPRLSEVVKSFLRSKGLVNRESD